MKIYENIVEYYDELFPITLEQKNFFNETIHSFNAPPKLLSIACGTGNFEHNLAKANCDVTGIENIPELLESASRKRRTQLMALRFFQMTPREMNRFLGKGFYNIISFLNDRIAFISDTVLQRKLFLDCKELLAKNGKCILSLVNYEKYATAPEVELPIRKSIRSTLYSRIIALQNDRWLLDQSLETGQGRLLTITEAAPIYPITQQEIDCFAKEAGFKHRAYYADFTRAPFDKKNSDQLVVELS